MSVQHVQQLQAQYGEVRERKEFTRGGRPRGYRARLAGTPESSYVAAYLKFLLGERKTLPPSVGLARDKAKRLREETARELAR